MNNNKTQEKRITEEMKDLEEFKRYAQELTDFLPIAFCVVNPFDLILEANKFFGEISGYGIIDSVGLNIKELFLEKREIEDFIEIIRRTDEKKEKELTLLSSSEEAIPVEIFALAKRNEDGDFTGYFLAIVDITERRKLSERLKTELEKKEEELKKKTEQMDDSRLALLNILEDVDENYKKTKRERAKTLAIIENFVDGMLFFDPEDRLTIINPKAEKLFGIDSEKVVGKKIKELYEIDQFSELLEFIEDKEKEENLSQVFREELQIGDNYFEITTTEVEEENESWGVLVHVHDVTREKRIERIKSEFVSVAAHQLRTPLSGIKWTLETFLEETVEEKEKLTEDEVDLIKKAYDANERMVNLINDLLNVSRIEEGRYIYEPQIVNIFDVIDPIVKNYKEVIEKKDNVEFKLNKVKKNFPAVKVDTEKISIVIQNLLDNAIKYTDKGEIVLSISMKGEDELKISVQDDGIGIPEEQQERLFNKFFRAGNVVRKDVEGSGLGLFISKNIVEAHGGEMGFESTEGVGSLFYFTLPTKKGDDEDFMRNF